MRDIDLIAAHLVGDYILQTNDEAVNKTKDFNKLLYHCVKYAFAFTPFLFATRKKNKHKDLFFILNFLSHMIIDHRRWASGEEWGPKPILVDQALHAVTLAILRRIL